MSSLPSPTATSAVPRTCVSWLLTSVWVLDLHAQWDWVSHSVQPLVSHHMAYDSGRQRVVMFGTNQQSAVAPETFEWDGAVWRVRYSNNKPATRLGHQMVYDAACRHVLLFGGVTPSGTWLNDTWAWDGDDWRPLASANRPGPMEGHTIAYDSSRRRVVLVGTTLLRQFEIWEWDGSDWAQGRPSQAPSLRGFPGLVYDAARQRTVLFGGVASGGGVGFADTWAWDGVNWSQLAPANAPAGRLTSMVYDSARQLVVLWGGRAGGVEFTDTWEWDGSNWRPVNTAVQPTRPGVRALAYDGARREVVAFGASFPQLLDTSTWLYDGVNWRVMAAVAPAPRGDHAIAFDAVRQRAVLFGGNASRGAAAETWEWDGTIWQSFAAVGQPPNAAEMVMVFDSARQRSVLITARATPSWRREVWEWDGAQWTLRVSGSGPDANQAEMQGVYDSARGRIVVRTVALSRSAFETWELAGNTWTRMTTVPNPAVFGAMAYDAARRVAVLRSDSPPSATWAYDGTSWSAVPTLTPSSLPGAMVYDAVRQRVIHVVADVAGAEEFDGTSWRSLTASDKPGRRYGQAVFYDSARRNIVMHGGYGLVGPRGDLWVLTPAPATVVRFGAGCAAAGRTVPQAEADPLALGHRAALRVSGAEPVAACMLGLSTANATVHVGPCRVDLASPIVPSFTSTNGSGHAELLISVPNVSALRGAVLFAQTFVLAPSGPLFGLDATAALRLAIGD